MNPPNNTPETFIDRVGRHAVDSLRGDEAPARENRRRLAELAATIATDPLPRDWMGTLRNNTEQMLKELRGETHPETPQITNALTQLQARINDRMVPGQSAAESAVTAVSTGMQGAGNVMADSLNAVGLNNASAIVREHPRAAAVIAAVGIGWFCNLLLRGWNGRPRTGWLSKLLIGTGIIGGLAYLGGAQAAAAETAPTTGPAPAPVIAPNTAPAEQAGKKIQAEQAGKKVEAEQAGKKVQVEQAEKQRASFLNTFPDGRNLVGQSAITFQMNDVRHTVSFGTNRMTLDGVDHSFIAVGATPWGGDVPLNVLDVRRNGATITFRAGALFREGTVRGDEAKIRTILTALLAGRPYEETVDRQLIRIR